jgi:urease accessory protein
MIGLLTALQQADSAFPSGSFAFSNGIEGLVANSKTGVGARLDRNALAAIVTAVLRHRWESADRVALVQAHRAGDDFAAIAAVDEALEVSTLAEPLRTGSKRNGAALLAAHVRLATPGAAGLRAHIDAGQARGHLPVVQGFVWRALGLSEDLAVAVSGYTMAAGLVMAAVRLGRIGAIDAQAALASALAVMTELAQAPVAPDTAIASFMPWLDSAVARHARASLRLFVN